MEGIDEKNNSDSNLDPKEDLEITKKFLIETIENSKTSSTVELSNYEEALDLFDQRSKEGKNIILYEIHKTKIDGSIVKKVPVLNSSKQAERMRVLPGDADATVNTPVSSPSSPDKKEKMTLKTMKNKIIILAAVVAGLILTLFILDILAGGGSGNMSGHLVVFDAIQNYHVQSTTNVDYT